MRQLILTGLFALLSALPAHGQLPAGKIPDPLVENSDTLVVSLQNPRLNRGIVGVIGITADEVDALFAESEAAIAVSRMTFGRAFNQKTEPMPARGRTTDIDWDRIQQTAQSRGETECCICMGPYTHQRPCTYLSCTHIFHETCLDAMEDLAALEKKRCPIADRTTSACPN